MTAPATLTATFSCSASGAMIAVESADGRDVVALDRPSMLASPLDALRTMGYQLAYPSQVYSLEATMEATTYAKLAVVPTP